MSFSLITGAFAIAAIVLVQGAGVAEAAPNTDGSPPNPNQDIIAQGAGNLASGFFRGMPVGGSVGQTALNVSVGARTRWAAIWSGVWLLVILAIFSGLVAKIAMPTLAAILIFAAIGSLRPGEIASILRTGRISQVAVITTFAATLFLPVAAAVGIGVALSLLLQLNQGAMDLTVVELIPLDGGRFEERPSPAVSDELSRDDPGRVWQPALRRCPDPGGSPSRPGRGPLSGGRAAVAAAHVTRGDLREGDDRLRRPPSRRRRPPLPQRSRARRQQQLRRTGQLDGPCARSRPTR